MVTDISTIDAVTFDPGKRATGTFRYCLSKPGLVRVLAVLREDTSLVFRILTDWQWRDSGSHVERWDSRDQSGNLIDNGRCLLRIAAADAGPRPEPASLPVRLALGEKTAAPVWPVLLDLPEPPEDPKAILEARLWLDYKPVLSREFRAGDLPLQLEVDTSGCGPGEHVLHVNVRSKDRLGVAGLLIRVARGESRLASAGPAYRERGYESRWSAAGAKGR